jgi:tricorn protease
MRFVFSIITTLFLIIPSFAQDEARLLRFPATHGNQIVFTYAGDLYTVSTSGGTARKLTNHDGFEMFARFSPDGKNLAFTGQYDGNTEVFLMPSEGGEPQRLTFTATLTRDDISDRMGPNNIVMGWKNKSQEIAFRSRMKSYNSFNGSLFTVSTNAGLPEQIPVPRGGFCTFSPDDNKMAYNRIFREFRTWKRYRGGMADDIWIYDFSTKQVENITSNPAQDIIPMWHGDKIYFLSDRDTNKRMNLYVYDLGTKETKQLTQYSDFDIKFPSLGDKAIAYEYSGYIYLFDLATQTSNKIQIQIKEDFVSGRPVLKNVSKNVSNYEISPDGKRALFGARGDVFTIPGKEGQTRNLTKSSGVHERNSKWSPDGKWIAYISDASGEDEIYIHPQDGSGAAKQVTKGAETYKYQLYWSPDSKKLLWADRKLRLRYVEVGSGIITEVDKSDILELRQYSWSPDSKWITYTKPEPDVMNRIYIYSLDSKKTIPVTEGWYSADNATFSSDGKYMLFTSSRDFNPIYSRTEWNHAYRDMSKVYLLTLQKETESPFKPVNDEVSVSKTKDSEEDKKKNGDGVTVNIDFEGISDRIVNLPIKASSYSALASVGNNIYYNRRGASDEKTLLLTYSLKDEKETELGNINGYEISYDQKKMLVNQNGKYAIIDLPKSKIKIDKPLDLSSMETMVDRKAEWTQIFEESWRQMREFFYVPNMHGVDWAANKDAYKPMVSHVNHRADLTYVIGEMISELNVGHAYVGGGDMPKPRRIKMGLLGAELKKDAKSGFYQITKILNGQNWDSKLRSPLTEIGVAASEGDYIIAINGQSTKNINNIYQTLINTAGKQVTLKLNDSPKDKGSREVIVIPTADESKLYHFEWVQNNIKKVNEVTDGKVGYIHIPDMGREGLNEFVKYFYPQIRKKALIVDVRGNGGGNVSPMIIERLRREIAMITFARNSQPSPNPGALIYGPLVCLADEFSASDGDLFTYRFKKHKLGKVVGKRTWGGVVGIRGSLPLLDGGTLQKPEFSRYDLEGKQYVIEGIGVEPDIFVDNDPAKEFAGIDQQLNKAIEVILEELKTKEKSVPPLPPYPEK